VFDRVVVVDWSANSTPKLGRDSIWIAVHDGPHRESVTNLATRAAAIAFLSDLIDSDPAASTLIGVDFSLGYPAGTAAALGLIGSEWSAMWDLLADRIDDDDRNLNNRFAVAAELNRSLSGAAAPFWGCPPSARNANLGSTKPSAPTGLAEFRSVEQVLRARGARPFSSWQLLGSGAVGSQSLLGIARLHDLRHRFGGRLQIWPFTTGLTTPHVERGTVVLVEVWPSMIPTIDVADEVRDAVQVRTTARWLAEADSSDSLAAWFSPSPPSDVAHAAVAEEGWVLGVMC
jgi:precorrin-8X/cobalt-precorrin-8 methylmutase